MKYRTFGWVQNPSSFINLKKVVQVFDNKSQTHYYLFSQLNQYVVDENVKQNLTNALKRSPLILKYQELIGTSYTPRASAPCDGIIQASIISQNPNKPYIDDWSSDGFIRWAHCLGFIHYIYGKDSFEITKTGLLFANSEYESEEEKELLICALLSYPPATRILELLSDSTESLTKFDIGKKLGFSGENGFTTLPQNILLEYLSDTSDAQEKNKIRSDWEGSADKYARMISKWLVNLCLVKQEKKYFTVNKKEEFITHSFKITGKGYSIYRKSIGLSKNRKIQKNVCWEMLATKGVNREYVRTRRAYIIKILQESYSSININTINEYLSSKGFTESNKVIENDILGFVNCGIRIEKYAQSYFLKDNIGVFFIPDIHVTGELKDELLEKRKRTLLNELHSLPVHYIGLLEISLDGTQNKALELNIIQLMKDIYGFKAAHMGGGRKPDGAAFCHNSLSYDIILDTKAYSKGYSLPINQADSMVRYIEEYKQKNISINPNSWWMFFSPYADNVYYLFVSSYFVGGFQDRLNNIFQRTGINGGVISIENLLYGANYILENRMTLGDFEKTLVSQEITIKGRY